MTDDQIREQTLEALFSAIVQDDAAAAADQSRLPDNLLTIVDSFGFVQLVAALEERLGFELDLKDVDIGNLVVSALLIDFVRQQIQTRNTCADDDLYLRTRDTKMENCRK